MPEKRQTGDLGGLFSSVSGSPDTGEAEPEAEPNVASGEGADDATDAAATTAAQSHGESPGVDENRDELPDEAPSTAQPEEPAPPVTEAEVEHPSPPAEAPQAPSPPVSDEETASVPASMPEADAPQTETDSPTTEDTGAEDAGPTVPEGLLAPVEERRGPEAEDEAAEPEPPPPPRKSVEPVQMRPWKKPKRWERDARAAQGEPEYAFYCPVCDSGVDESWNFCHNPDCHTPLLPPKTVEKKPSFFQRLKERFTPDRSTAITGGRGHSSVVGKAKQARRKASSVRRLIIMGVILLGAVGLSVGFSLSPGKIVDWGKDRWDSLTSDTTPVTPTAVEVTSQLPDFPAANMIDQTTNTHWSEGVPGLGEGTIVTFRFQEPFDLFGIGFRSGPGGSDRFVSEPRPRVVSITYSDGTGTSVELDDVEDFQELELEATAIDTVVMRIDSVYPSPDGGENMSISEVEFFRKK